MSVYEIITDRIIKKLEEGTAPWLRPWNSGEMPRNLVTGKTYRGINLFVLNMQNFSSPYFVTFLQCKERGGHIRAGEKSTPVVFWNTTKKKDAETDEEKNIPFLRYYNVFNVEQTEGLTIPASETKEIQFNPLAECERIIKKMPKAPEIRHGGFEACYIPSSDCVKMPKPENFINDAVYYSTLFHELTHATGHEKRLHRKGITENNAFGSANYGKEELCAEMGASFLCGITGIETRTIDNSASYVASWLRVIRADKKMIITAAAQAQKAVDYITNMQHEGGI
jgi:antirestriction protein ArdC